MDASCPLTAGHVGHLLQLLQDGVHAGGRLLHLLSKVPQHAGGQQRHFKLRWRILARFVFTAKSTVVAEVDWTLFIDTVSVQSNK